MGLNLENCEQWFQRAVMAILGGMVVVIVVRVRGIFIYNYDGNWKANVIIVVPVTLPHRCIPLLLPFVPTYPLM
jgi:hypothetical protein